MCQLLLLKLAPGSERIQNEGDGEKETELIYFSDRTRSHTENGSHKLVHFFQEKKHTDPKRKKMIVLTML